MKTLYWIFSDIVMVMKRNLIRYIRLPQLIVFSTIQPIMFVLLFAYVFGGAIRIPGVEYITYLLPGILVQVVIFGSIQTGVGLADDISHGMIDRFRSLPMARSAVLAGRTLADLIRNIFVVSLMTGVGYLIGFEIKNGVVAALEAMAIALAFGFAFSWVAATIGLLVKNAETAQVAGFIWVFPLVFASSIFVPIHTMPEALETFASISPITVTVDTIRGLVLGLDIEESLWKSLAWIAGILIVFMPLAVRKYRKSV